MMLATLMQMTYYFAAVAAAAAAFASIDDIASSCEAQ